MKQQAQKKLFRILIVGDLHGEMPNIKVNNFDAIICPGDICSDNIRKYVKKWIKERTRTGNHDLDFDKFCPQWKQKILQHLSIKKGRKVLKYLNSFRKPVFLVPGNWDPTPYTDGYGSNIRVNGEDSLWDKVKSGLEFIIDVEFKEFSYKGLIFIGTGSVSAPEILEKGIKKDFEDEDNPKKEYEKHMIRYNFFTKVYNKLDGYFNKVKKVNMNDKINRNSPVVFISHNSPYNTKLDKVNAPGTYAHNKHYGSIIARKLIEEYQPMICVSGHIHEGHGKTCLRKTICINSGFGGDVNTIVDIDLDKKKIVNIEF